MNRSKRSRLRTQRMNLPEPVCLRVAELRKRGIASLKEYDADAANARVIRRGRVFVDGVPYVYGASPWANPYPVRDDCTLEQSLAAYERWLDAELAEPVKRAAFVQLAHKKTIGCYCSLDALCHRDIILERLAALLQ